jgi:hypothetical protein
MRSRQPFRRQRRSLLIRARQLPGAYTRLRVQRAIRITDRFGPHLIGGTATTSPVLARGGSSRSHSVLHRGSARIRLSEGSIGHVEYWFEQRLGLRMAALENKAGNFITPTAHAGELALSGRVAQVQELAASVADPSGADAYPLVSYSWMLVYAQYGIRPRQLSCVSFAGWSLSDRGQDYGAQLGYLQLSSDVLSIGRQALVN